MTKADIVESVYANVKLSKKESTDVVELVLEVMKDRLEQGEKVKISGFGNFMVKSKRSRPGRNPLTGAQIEISARRVLVFRASQVLKSALNAGASKGPTRPGSR